MPLTDQPAKNDGSIGRVKSDAIAIDDIDTQVPAAEFERLKSFLIDVCDEVGNHAGTEGSLNARIAAAEAIVGAEHTVDASATYTVTPADRGHLIVLTHATPTLEITEDAGDGFWCLVLGTQGPVTFDGATLSGGVVVDEQLFADSPAATAGQGALAAVHVFSLSAFPEPPVTYAKIVGELERTADYATQIGALAAATDSFNLTTLNNALSGANLDAAGTARPPTNHASNHFAGAADEIEPGDINALHEDTEIEDSAATSRTLSASDRNKLIRFTNAAGCKVTIPHTVAAGISFVLVRDAGAGAVTVVGSGGMSILLAPDVDAEIVEGGMAVATVIVTGASGVAKLAGELEAS